MPSGSPKHSLAYSPRIVDTELDELLAGLPAVALEGAKGVGKTATAARRVTTVVRLDEPAQRAIALADPALVVRNSAPILLDEWQHVPSVWDAVRRAVDEGAPPGTFLLAGSASPVDPPAHTGAGRIVRVRMRPLSLAERGIAHGSVSLGALLEGKRPTIDGESAVDLAGYAQEIVASGFPALRNLTDRQRRAQLDGYLARIVDRDVPDAGHAVRQPEALQRWMTAFAAATATTTSLEKIRHAAAGSSASASAHTTTIAYRDALTRLWMIDPVAGWIPARNRLTRLAQAPRHHLADPALAARLLGVDQSALLAGATSPLFGEPVTTTRTQVSHVPRDGTLFGQLFESLVTQSVQVYAQSAEARVYHLRTYEGRHEVDLVVMRRDERVVAIEVKLSATVNDDDVRHLHWLRDQLGADLLDAVVVTTGPRAYRRADGIAVVPAALLMP